MIPRGDLQALWEELGWKIGLPCKNDLFSETEHQFNSAAYMKLKGLSLCIFHLQYAFDIPEHQLGCILNEPPQKKEEEGRISRGSKFEATKSSWLQTWIALISKPTLFLHSAHELRNSADKLVYQLNNLFSARNPNRWMELLCCEWGEHCEEEFKCMIPKLLHRFPGSYLPGLVKPVHLHSHLCIYIRQPVSSLASTWSESYLASR